MRVKIIIQSPHDGTTIKKARRVVHNIERDEYGNEIGKVKINGLMYEVARNTRNGPTWYSDNINIV